MLSFSTEFPISDTDISACTKCIRDWLLGSPHTTFTSQQLADNPSHGRWVAITPKERVEALISERDGEKIAAFRHNLSAGDLTWETEVVFSIRDESSFVGIRTSRQSTHAQISLPKAKKPHVIKTILDNLGGGLDGELYVQDSPHLLVSNDARMIARLINGDAENYLPVVYVSRTFNEELPIRPDPLARRLSGLAHVVVEPDRAFSRSIQRDVDGRNAYGGRVGMHWPNGQSFYVSPETMGYDDIEVRRLIEGRITDALLNRRSLARCTWAVAEAEVARLAIETLRSSGSGNVDEYIAAFDDELAAKDRQLREAEEEIWKLESKIKTNHQQGSAVGLALGAEVDFFPGEIAEIVSEALHYAAQNAQQDSRREHVLSAAAGANGPTAHLASKKEQLKEILRGYSSMTKDIAATLGNLGFSISEDGKHHKIKYMDDDRYVFALPKSGSDWRGGLNAASDIAKRVF